MSGGVDSGVAAARLHDAGYEVVGCTLHLWDYPEEDEPGGHGRCCAPEDQYDARRTADALGFPHYSFDRRKLFEERVVRPFVESYLTGETPSPCSACNRGVKLGELFRIADRLGCASVATGHYARIERDARGVAHLATGLDGDKDQSYFLYATPQAELERLVFPLGESTKPEVRAEAVARRLPGATKGESQELCFVGAGKGAYARFVEERARDRVRPGPIVDALGHVVGHHEGVHRFTVGQRKGLGVALGAAAFVTSVDPERGTVHLGTEDALRASAAVVEDLVLADGVALPTDALVRIRYRHEGTRARVEPHPRGATVRFFGEARAVTRGQVAVFYEGARVLGGGRITNVSPMPASASAARAEVSP